MSQEDFNQLSLKRSIEKVGQLYPVIVNQDGKILDGNHRSAEIVNPEKKVVQTKNRYDELKVRGNAHYRRRVPQEETRQLVVEMANEAVKLGTPKNEVAKRLFEDLPYSEGYILLLLPDDFKEKAKVEAGKSAHLVEHTVKTHDMVICEFCHIASSDIQTETVNSKPRKLCVRCQGNFVLAPERFTAFFRNVNGESKTLEERLAEKPMPAFKEKWEHKLGTMQTDDPKVERIFSEEAQALGLHGFRVKPEIPVISVWPDNFHVETNTLFWMDNEELHKGKRSDKDDQYRAILEGRGFKNEVFRYKGEPSRAKVREFLVAWQKKVGA